MTRKSNRARNAAAGLAGLIVCAAGLVIVAFGLAAGWALDEDQGSL